MNTNKKILFFTKYPNKNDLKDGYFQRVLSVDKILSEYGRVYVNYSSGKFLHLKRIDKNIFEIETLKYNPLGLVAVVFFVFFSDVVYLHSILRLKSYFHRVLFLFGRKRILDLHGVVPEEFEVQGDLSNFKNFNKIEKFAVSNADVIIGVTNKMVNYVLIKHKIKERKNIIIMPILPGKKNISEKLIGKQANTVIYCGGLQKWQQVDKMLEFVNKNNKNLEFTFLVPNPEELLKIYKEKYNTDFPGLVTSSPSDKVVDWYSKNSLGLILREDMIVNNAACPTKLIEYFQNDVLPIVDSENIGDFKEMGFEYVKIGEEVPDFNMWRRKILKNREVYNKICKQFETGSQKINGII